MISLQFDECFTSKTIRARCQAEGKVVVKSFPHRMRSRSVKDAEVVERFLPSESSLVTTDHRLLVRESSRIPDRHPGIIVVRHNGPHTQREKDIIQVLENFKSRVQNWEQLKWRNSVVELYQDRAEIYAIKGAIPTPSVAIFFSDADFEQELAEALAANASEPTTDDGT